QAARVISQTGNQSPGTRHLVSINEALAKRWDGELEKTWWREVNLVANFLSEMAANTAAKIKNIVVFARVAVWLEVMNCCFVLGRRRAAGTWKAKML
ncbi:hypothetical protein, partial [Litchfieldella anticariensis]|uniref:hypothetical protein n=1 Tax=Litchfieldella anticariensis TaxID=258591 RepID=UPI00054D30A8